jgi:hypothetical protein
MTEIIRIGVDIAKNVFEVHAVNAQEQVVVRRSLRRNGAGGLAAVVCLIGMVRHRHLLGVRTERARPQVRRSGWRTPKPMSDGTTIC